MQPLYLSRRRAESSFPPLPRNEESRPFPAVRARVPERPAQNADQPIRGARCVGSRPFGFSRLGGRATRFAVAQDARGSDPSLAMTRNPVNVGLRASGRKALLPSTTSSGRIRSVSTRRDRDPHFNSDTCGLAHILPGSRQFDHGVLRREKSQGEKCHDRPI
jgi:hypothetical protein